MTTFILLLLLLLARPDGDSAVGAQTYVHGAVGGDVLLKCPFTFAGLWKIFCKTVCTGDGVLVQTTEDRVQSGRFGLRYDQASHALYVSISRLTASDSGWYLCGLAAASSATYSTSSFSIILTKASTPQPTSTWPPDCESEEVTPPAPRHDVVDHVGHGHQENSADVSSGVSLHVGVSLVVFTVVLSSVAAVSCYIWKTKVRGSKSERRSGATNMEEVLYENCPPGVLNYESLDPAHRDQNQDYFTLTQRPG